MKDKKRLSGILLHPTSLPSPYGIGDLGEAAYEFVDFLAAAGQHLWQILPLTVSRTIRHLSEPALQILLPWLQPLLKICLPDCNNFNRLNYRLKIG